MPISKSTFCFLLPSRYWPMIFPNGACIRILISSQVIWESSEVHSAISFWYSDGVGFLLVFLSTDLIINGIREWYALLLGSQTSNYLLSSFILDSLSVWRETMSFAVCCWHTVYSKRIIILLYKLLTSLTWKGFGYQIDLGHGLGFNKQSVGTNQGEFTAHFQNEKWILS